MPYSFRFRSSASSQLESLVARHRATLTSDFFAYVNNLIGAAHEDAAEQEALASVAAQIATLAEAYDQVTKDGEAMQVAAAKFDSLLQVRGRWNLYCHHENAVA